MKAALVGASDFNAGHFACENYGCVVAVDGGYAHLDAIGVAPDAVVAAYRGGLERVLEVCGER